MRTDAPLIASTQEGTKSRTRTRPKAKGPRGPLTHTTCLISDPKYINPDPEGPFPEIQRGIHPSLHNRSKTRTIAYIAQRNTCALPTLFLSAEVEM